jgi:hypothetical protein
VNLQQEPYTLVTKLQGSSDKYSYSGFIPDLMAALARRLHFKYEFYHVSEYGRFTADNEKWTGLIGEVILNDVSVFLSFTY